MGTEIERKFLVATDGWRGEAAGPGVPIRQGYLARGSEVEVRVRRAGERGMITIKAGKGLVRSEHEWPIEADDADDLLGRSLPIVIAKTRTVVPAGPYRWEVDEYEEALAGLVVAEIELDAADATIDLPSWLGREVTGENGYSNASLSARGLPGRQPAVYVTNAHGLSEADRRYAEEEVLPTLRAAGLEPLDLRDDPELIRFATGMLAILDGTDIDSGTAAEIGFAAALGLPVTGLRTDPRAGDDNDEVIVNHRVEGFVRQGGGTIHRDLDSAVAELATLVRS